VNVLPCILPAEPTSCVKKILFSIALIIALLLGFWLWHKKSAPKAEPGSVAAEDSAGAVSAAGKDELLGLGRFFPASRVNIRQQSGNYIISLSLSPKEAGLYPPEPNYMSYVLFDVFVTTNPAASRIHPSPADWTFVRQSVFAETNFVVKNIWPAKAYFLLGTIADSDNDGLTDTYEMLVSRTDPNQWDSNGNGISDGDETGPNGLPWRLEEVRSSAAVIMANASTAKQGGADGQCTVYLPHPAPSGGCTVGYYTGGFAGRDVDYIVSPGGNQLFIPAGATSGTFTVHAALNNHYAPMDLYAEFMLTNTSCGAANGWPARVNVINTNEPGMTVSAFPSWLHSPSPTYGTNTAGFDFVRGGPSTGALTAQISVSGTAVAGVDYVALPKTIYFPPEVRTNWLPLNILSHCAIADKSLTLAITNAPGYQLNAEDASASITIAASGRPPLPVVQVFATVPQAYVGWPGQFTFTRLGSTNETLRVFYQSFGDTVTAYVNGQHIISYEGLRDVVDIPAGSTYVTVPVIPIQPPSTGLVVRVSIRASRDDYTIGRRRTAAVQIHGTQ